LSVDDLFLLTDRENYGLEYFHLSAGAVHPREFLNWGDWSDSEKEYANTTTLPALHEALDFVYERNLQRKIRMGGAGGTTLDSYWRHIKKDEGFAEEIKTTLRKWQDNYMEGVSDRTIIGQWYFHETYVKLSESNPFPFHPPATTIPTHYDCCIL